jgi:hypothetical protein
MAIEEFSNLAILRDLGFGIISLLIIFILGKQVTENSYKLLEEANKRGQESHNEFRQFIETAYKENTATMGRFCNIFDEHIKAKDSTLQMLKEQQEMYLSRK